MKERKIGLSVQSVVAIGIGAAVFFILMKFIAIPAGPNLTFNVGEGWLSLLAAIFGPIVGFFVALIGHTLNDSIGGQFWWSWILADGIFGLLMGLTKPFLALKYGDITQKKLIQFNVWQVVANAVSWLVIAPMGDILIYQEPAGKVFTQGAITTGCNILSVGIVGTLFIIAYAKSRPRQSSLRAE